MALTDKQERFVNEYVIDLNATAAYKRAYGSNLTEGAASAAASRLLKNVKVQDEIDKRIQERAKDTGITVNYVLSSLKNVADRCMQAEPVYDKEGEPTGEYRFDASGANRALELLGKHLKMFTDKVESDNTNDTTVHIVLDGDLEEWAK